MWTTWVLAFFLNSPRAQAPSLSPSLESFPQPFHSLWISNGKVHGRPVGRSVSAELVQAGADPSRQAIVPGS